MTKEFLFKRVPAYITCLPILIISIGHLYFNREVNDMILYDLATLAATLFIYPRVRLNGYEQSHLLVKNIFSYVLLVVIIIPASLLDFLSIKDVSEGFFTIMTGITAAVFGLSKLNISRDSVKFAIGSITDLQKEYKTKKSTNDLEILKLTEKDKNSTNLPDELIDIKKYNLKTLAQASSIFVGVKEISGNKHNAIILQFGKWAGVDWYLKDETPWCAVFVNAMRYVIGKDTNKSALAKSFLDEGIKVSWKEVQQDTTNVILVYHRGTSINSYKGHVDVLESVENETLNLISANISNSVLRKSINYNDLMSKTIKDGTREFIEFRRL